MINIFEEITPLDAEGKKVVLDNNVDVDELIGKCFAANLTTYNVLIQNGATRESVRSILPIALKREFYLTDEELSEELELSMNISSSLVKETTRRKEIVEAAAEEKANLEAAQKAEEDANKAKKAKKVSAPKKKSKKVVAKPTPSKTTKVVSKPKATPKTTKAVAKPKTTPVKPTKRYVKFNVTDIANIMKASRKGQDIKKIAEKFGVSVDRIATVIRKNSK